MAIYYWVGGNGTWDNTSTTNWSTSSGGVGGSGPPTNADTVNFDSGSGTAATVTVASTAVSLSTTINKSDINISLSGSPTLCTSAGTLTLTSGAITLNDNTLIIGRFNSNNTNTRSIAFGTGSIELTGNNARLFDQSAISNFSYTGSGTINWTYSGSSGTRSAVVASTATESQALNHNVTAGSDTFQFYFTFRNLSLNGFTGTYVMQANVICFGGINFPSTANVTMATYAYAFNATSGSYTITTGNNKTFNSVSFRSGSTSNATWTLQDNLTTATTSTTTFGAGTLDLNGQTLSTGLFVSSNSAARSIAFNNGNITLTGSGTVWNTNTATNFSRTGAPTVNVSNNSATATTIFTGAMSEAQALDFNYTVGTYTLTDSNSVYRSLSFSGFTGTVPNSARTIYGNLTIASGATNSAGANATTFAATSGTQQITTNGVTLDYPLTFNGVGGTFVFQDSLTQGSTRAFTITNGTVRLKDGVTGTVGAFATSGTTQKFLQSALVGSQATLSQASGTINANNLTIQDINATGGATWNAFYENGNIDAGNNTGWEFGGTPAVTTELTYRLRSFTTPRRF